MSTVTFILNQIENGDPSAADELLPLVYDELRRLAASKLSNEKPGQTLQSTALVHEAYLRLVDSNNAKQHWDSRRHFFSAAAEAMRRILIEIARKKKGPKAGGHFQRIGLSSVEPATGGPDLDILSLDEALQKLEIQDKRKADLVNLRYFAGLTHEQAAEALGVSVSTADNEWAYAKAWLRVELGGENNRSF